MERGYYSEDEVRDMARDILGFADTESVQSGVGQITTFNMLGFDGVADKPDGWYLPNEPRFPAIVLETKNSSQKLDRKCRKELLKNIDIVKKRYNNVVGILYNGYETVVYKGAEEFSTDVDLKNKEYYLGLFERNTIDKNLIYTLTKSINDTLHIDFGINNLYHRMIFTACALVAKRYGAFLAKGMPFAVFKSAIKTQLEQSLSRDLSKNIKLNALLDVYTQIQINNVDSQEAIDRFISCITQISDNINSDFWNGEDVMAIFFNEFNRYKKKAEQGQVFTPDHITSLMYRILETNSKDVVLDAACGSGAFLIKAMCNMINEVGGVRSLQADEIAQTQLYGIEYHKEIYALACANMLIHKDGKTNLELMDSRGAKAGEWIKSKPVTKVLMNPPFENKFGCLEIVKNVLDNVARGTLAAFILPDNKLNKNVGKAKRLLKKNRLLKIIKLPEKIFSGTVTSVFVFQAGIPQGNNEIFTCYIEEDGLETVKNQGRQDVRNAWKEIEDFWVDVIRKQSGHDSVKWISPAGKLSYALPEVTLVLNSSDFNETVLNFELFRQGIDEQEFRSYLSDVLLYGVHSAEDAALLKAFVKVRRSGIDISQWKRFKVAHLFDDPERPAARSKLNYEPGTVPFVASGNRHNGVECYVTPKSDADFDRGECLSISPVDGSTFYQPVDFLGRGGAGSSIILIRLKAGINEQRGLFLSTLLRALFAKFKFADMANSRDLPHEELPLPVNSQGDPDWKAMEKMIKPIQKTMRQIVALYMQARNISALSMPHTATPPGAVNPGDEINVG